MPTQQQSKTAYTWDDQKIVDDVLFQEKDAETFKNLLSRTSESPEGTISSMVTGSILKGKIVEITKDHVVIDVGLKSEGLVPINEFSDPAQVYLDSEVEVLLDQPEDQNGQIVLSREKAERLRQWEHIVNHCEEGSIVKGRVLRKVKGGLMVDIGMEAFLPGSQIDNKRTKALDLDHYIGHTYDFKIIKINIQRKNVVVSRRELLEAERIAKKAEVLEHIKPGDIREGVVKNITDFGVFLDLDGIDGLLHITDMTWKRIRHPSEMVQIGQRLPVMILNIDKDKGRVALGLKQKEANPWDEIEKKYPPGTIIEGRVVNVTSYGAFIELEEGIEGLVHISEMSWSQNTPNAAQLLTKGGRTKAMVLSVQKDEGKISLGIKQTEHNPWDDVEKKYPIGKVIQVQVRTLTNYGAFVQLEPGIEGLIHISDFSWTKKFSHPADLLKQGDLIDALIISLDKESKKITLGIKQLSDNPWENIEKTLQPGTLVQGSVTKITAFGVFVRLDNDIEGLIHVTELHPDRPVNVGDTITARVIKVDPEHKKIALSVKEEQGNSDDIIITAPT